MPSDQRHGHWLTVMVTSKGHVEYYDSLAKPPGHYSTDIKEFITHWSAGNKYKNNTVQHQPNGSNLCGLYVLYVSDLYCRGVSYDEIMESFDDKVLVLNEEKVADYFAHHMYTGLVRYSLSAYKSIAARTSL